MSYLSLFSPGLRAGAALLMLGITTACGALGAPPPAPTPAPSSTPVASRPESPAVAGVQQSPPGGNTTQSSAVNAGVTDLRNGVRSAAQRAQPATVQITTQQTTVDQFNRPFSVPAGVGTGVIYDREGHIITNNHVIEGAQGIQVSLADGRSLSGRLVGQDPQTDLAVLQISGDNLPVAELGDSRQLQVGDWVVAIGNALGLSGGPTVTQGVVSALGRAVQEPSDEMGRPGPYLFDAIQTDAAINPGNSGGPLVNLNGQVIGINTLVANQAGPGVSAQGIGFAIAISTAKPIADQLVATGRVAHPYLGVNYASLNPSIAAQLGIATSQKGVVVGQVVPGSPAAGAGLRTRDVITNVDGSELTTDSSFAQILNQKKPGDTVSLTVQRGGQAVQVQAKLGEMPS
jgi:serine protease Do